MSKYTNAIRKLAKIRALDSENAETLLNAHVREQDGGPGSGNFSHKGRPGKRGGSAPREGGGNYGHAGRPGAVGGPSPAPAKKPSGNFGHTGRTGKVGGPVKTGEKNGGSWKTLEYKAKHPETSKFTLTQEGERMRKTEVGRGSAAGRAMMQNRLESAGVRKYGNYWIAKNPETLKDPNVQEMIKAENGGKMPNVGQIYYSNGMPEDLDKGFKVGGLPLNALIEKHTKPMNVPNSHKEAVKRLIERRKRDQESERFYVRPEESVMTQDPKNKDLYWETTVNNKGEQVTMPMHFVPGYGGGGHYAPGFPEKKIEQSPYLPSVSGRYEINMNSPSVKKAIQTFMKNGGMERYEQTGAAPGTEIERGTSPDKIAKKAVAALRGVSGEIDPKDYPEIFPGGEPFFTKRKGGIKLESVSVVRGDAGKKYLEFKWSDGQTQRKRPDEAAIKEHELYENEKRFNETAGGDPFSGMSEAEKADFIDRLKKEEENRKRDQEMLRNYPPSARWMPDPSPFRGTKEQAKNHFDLDNNMVSAADWAFEHKGDFPKDSIEYEAYEDMENKLANHSYRRPTPADSARMIQERLSNISTKLQPAAVDRYKKDMENEPQITQDVCEIADALGTEMWGLEYRTKTAGDNSKGVCRIQEKIEQDLEEDRVKAERAGRQPTLTYQDCVNGLNDLVRYTQMSTEDNLVENYEKTVKALEAKNYKVVKVKNFYNKDPMENPYRGLTVVFESPTGTKFEFQFHTPRSILAKEAAHPIYDIDRTYNPYDPAKSEISEQEHLALQARMREVYSKKRIPYPKGIEKIQDYPPKKKT